MPYIDWLVAELLIPLAVWVCISGLDDIFLDFQFAWHWLRGRIRATKWAGRGAPRPHMALLIPCWREEAVLEGMLERNSASISCPQCDIWVGLYPNDQASLDAFDRAASRLPRVRKAIGPRSGPTTKADNLNAVWSEILEYEGRAGVDYDAVLFHDAEDVIHPLEPALAAMVLERSHMAQFPVFPIETPLADFTHGVYCDEFAEHHVKELRVRAVLGGFIPSAGVGTALHREVLDQLRIERGEDLLNPRSLTEDYFLGLDVKEMGFRQEFPLFREPDSNRFIATRAYFPRSFKAAVKQRTRWVIGNNLQAWERFGWRVGLRQLYWLWRDRKGLVNHAASLATNLCFLYGLATAAAAYASGTRWRLGEMIRADDLLFPLISVNAAMFAWRCLVRIACCRQVYGWKHSLTVPLRMPWANIMNFCATTRALKIFFSAKYRKRALTWSKTAHAFPGHAAAAGPVAVPTAERARAAGAGGSGTLIPGSRPNDD